MRTPIFSCTSDTVCGEVRTTKFRVTRPPVLTPELVCKHDTHDGPRRGKLHLEGVAPDLGGDRAKQCQAASFVIVPRTQNQSGAAPSLLVACLRRELQPHEIPSIRNVVAGYHRSLPREGPMSSSGCRFSAVIRLTMSSRS